MITEIKGILRYTISNGVMPIYITPLLPQKKWAGVFATAAYSPETNSVKTTNPNLNYSAKVALRILWSPEPLCCQKSVDTTLGKIRDDGLY